MKPEDMIELHRDADSPPWLWRLTPRTASRLAPAPRPRWLRVRQGRVWLTRSGRPGARPAGPGEDIWLGPDERIALPAGSEWVAEGWPEASIELLESAPTR